MTAPRPAQEAEDEDASQLVPALLTAYSAYAVYRAAKGEIEKDWQVVVAALGLPAILGAVLLQIATRALGRQRTSAGRGGDQLWQFISQGMSAGRDAGLKTIADALIYTDDHTTQQTGTRDTGGTVPTADDPPEILAEITARATANAAQMEVAELAGWTSKTWHCLVGDVPVLGVGVRWTTRHWYEGNLVEARTANNRRIAMTPEHLVLTCSGWKQAQFLNPGDHVAAVSRVESVGTPQVERVPPKIGELLDPVHDLRTELRVVNGLVDLHVDPSPRNTDVEVVPIDSELRDALDPGAGHPLHDLGLVHTDLTLGALLADGPSLENSFRLRNAAHAVSQSDSAGSLHSGAFTSDTDQSGFRMRSNPDTGFGQEPNNGRLTSTNFSGDGQEGLPLGVAMDEILTINIVPSRCHVYDLVTDPGFFLADGVIVHNSMRDDRVRETHQRMDGQTQPLGSPFVSPSGATLMFPCDPSAPIEERAGCRCGLRTSRR